MKSNFKKQNVPFTQVANEVLADKSLSFAAKGMFAYLFSKPEDWQYSSDRIKNDSRDGKRAVLAHLKELEKAGYLTRQRQSSGRVLYFLKHSQSAETALGVETQSAPTAQSESAQSESAPVSNIDNIVIKKDTNIPPQGGGGDGVLVNKLIDAFSEVNPAYARLFPRKNERGAASRLIAEHGLDHCLKIAFSLKISNGRPYAPTITTPSQLEMKFGTLKSFWEKEKAGRKGKAIIGL